MSQRTLLVTGATGKQGGGLIKALLSKPSQPFEIYALTRDKTSKASQSLAEKPNVRVIQGDFSDVESIFEQIEKPLWGIFTVTLPPNAKVEEQQGKALTKAAVEAGVEHIVFTATDRGGPGKSDSDPTPIPHFASKFNIERDILEEAKESNGALTYTFLRPVAFFENLRNDFLGRGFMAMWRMNGLDRKLQLISTTDIGKVAAEAFIHADSEEYRNKAISLAGDELSPNEAAKIFEEETGMAIPSSYEWVGWALRTALKSHLGVMFDWFKDSGFKADLPALRQKYPFMKDFRAWLVEESAWKKN